MSLFKIQDEWFAGEVRVISTSYFPDNRGFYSVPYREDEFKALGLPTRFVQDNYSVSRANVVRGLHFQLMPAMGKLMRVTRGSAFLIAVDLRIDSPTFLEYHSIVASEKNMLQVWASSEFARGFYTYEDNTVVQYKCTGMFNAKSDSTVRWNDPQIGINWPSLDPILSIKDANAQTVTEYFMRRKDGI